MLLAILGADCSEETTVTFLEPISKVVTVSFFFGISGFTLSSSGDVPVYDVGFDITSPEQQEFLLNVSTEAR